MKIKTPTLLLAFFTITTLGSLFAEMDQSIAIEQQSNLKTASYHLSPNNSISNSPISITLAVDSWLCIKGDKRTELVGGNEITHAGCRQFDGTHIIKYEGGIGGKEGTKTTYNVSLWSFNHDDYTASIEDESKAPLKIEDTDIHDLRGLWKFQALYPTPKNTPQELTFTNEDGSTATIKVTVMAAQ